MTVADGEPRVLLPAFRSCAINVVELPDAGNVETTVLVMVPVPLG